MNITTTIKTPRHYDANRPFGASHMIRQPTKRTDPATLEICNDPLPLHRASCGNKYEATFKALKLDQAIKCKSEEVGRISGALRKWVETKKLKATVKSIRNYGDGMGRVWLVSLPAKVLKAA